MTGPEAGRSEEIARLRSASDAELVLAVAEGAARGDARAADVFVERHAGHIRANCEFIVRDPETARDLAQEVMVKAYFALTSYQGQASLRTWVRRIKVNHCLNHMARHSPTLVDVEATSLRGDHALRVEPRVDIEAGDRQAAVAAVLTELTDTLRIPLVLRDVDGYSYAEIAESLHIKTSAAKMRVKRGREQFRQIWTDRFGEEP
ncbi:MAG: RNA polymerase sigma factor [Gemmatimonadetes bacterium]|nr:RNA polymerase sigma factor [Gemmatimonadota bacterium]